MGYRKTCSKATELYYVCLEWFLWCVCSSSCCHILSSLSITSADSVDLGQVSRTCGTGGLDCRGVGQQQQPPNSPPPLSPFGDLRLNKGQRSNWCCGLAIKAIKKNIDFDCWDWECYFCFHWHFTYRMNRKKGWRLIWRWGSL